MSRMSTPKMDVVRFKEADVIVASGGVPQTMSVSGWKDGIKGNFGLEYGNTIYSLLNHNTDGFGDLLRQNGQSTDVHTTTGSNTTIKALYTADYKGTDVNFGDLDGLEWDSTNNRWNTVTH